jgi:hypothetical protein
MARCADPRRRIKQCTTRSLFGIINIAKSDFAEAAVI